MWADRVRRWAPGVGVARRYPRSWWRHDIGAGVVLTALLVPAGIGYARAAGLPAEAGLYATIGPLLVYAVVGPSRVLVLGPDSALAPIIAVSVLPLALGDEDRAVALAGLLAVMVGVLLVLGGLLRLGAVTVLLSKPIRIGYLNGIALVVLLGQLPALLGSSVDPQASVAGIASLAGSVARGEVVVPALVVGVGSLATILVLRRLVNGAVGVLVAVVGATVAVALLGLDERLPVVGALPSGLPQVGLGDVGWTDVAALAGPALGIALLAFADTAVLSRAFAARRGETVDSDAEMRALGLANVAGGVIGGFPVSASSSRTPVVEQAGARSQLAAVVGALLLLAFILLAPGLTGYLPSAALAAVVMVAASTLADLRATAHLLRVQPLEGALSVAAFLGVVFLGVLEGIVVAIALSLAAFVRHASRPYRTELGLIPGVRGYHDLARHPEAHRIPGLAIVRFDAPLFFANGTLFADHVQAVVTRTGRRVETVILAAEPITDVDSTGLDALVELDDSLAAQGIRLVLAEVKGPVKDRLRRYDVRTADGASRFGPERFAPTVGAAVDAVTGDLRGDLPRPGGAPEGPESPPG
ncbi:SulP family inorganic anion transporter [Actinotalea sp.]|uniref:SulP family inorganic anion transporter n=1 Tax=Actinotalea sp. TaxID=1872145 RepID=UPI003567FEDE